MDSFKQTDIGLIPDDWDVKKLSEASEIIMGQSPPSSMYNSNSNGLPFYQGKTDFGNIYPTPRIWCTSPSKIAEKNDILISVRAPVGPTNLSFEKSGIGRGLSAIRVRQNNYLYFYFFLKKIEREIEKLGTGSTFKAINKNQLHSIKIPLPPLPEQKKIAHILSKIQQAIETQEHIIKTTQELKKTLMQKLFTEGLNGEPQKQTEIGLIPESWEVKKIDEITKIQTGGTPSRNNPIYWNGDIPWVKTGEVNYDIILNTEEKITLAGLNNSATRIAPKGTLLVAMYGQGITRGRVAILGIEAAFNQACAALFPDEDTVLTKYLFLYLTYNYEYLRSLGHGANQRNLNTNLIKSVFCPIPSIGEQKIIVDSIRAVDVKLKSYLLKVKILKDLFSSSLNGLMTGQIRAKDIEFKL